MPALLEVRAIPAQGHLYRRAGGRAWGKDPVVVTVVDKPRTDAEAKADGTAEHPFEISKESLADLKSDKRIAVSATSAEDAADAAAKVLLVEAEGKIAQLRKQVEQLTDTLEAERGNASAELTKAQTRVQDLEKLVAELQAKRRAKIEG